MPYCPENGARKIQIKIVYKYREQVIFRGRRFERIRWHISIKVVVEISWHKKVSKVISKPPSAYLILS